MSISKAEFFRGLSQAVAPFPYSIGLNAITVSLTEGIAVIRLTPQSDLKAAMLSLPVLAVDITFDAVSTEHQKAFIQQFERAFHRGGG